MTVSELMPDPRHHTLSLVTYRRSGEEVRTPIWFVVEEDGFWVSTFRDSWKAKRLRNNPQVRYAPCDSSGKKILGDWAAGSAQLLDDPQRLQWLTGQLRHKYTWRYFLIVQIIYPLLGRRGEKVMIHVVPTI
jgi:PPOX class probable F420-dependent enzyme